jgi:hypothetical protein
MANPYSKGAESIIQSEHISPDKTGDNIEAKRVANYVWNGSAWERQSSTAASSGLTDAELRATPVEVNAGNKDIFGYQVIVQPYNQIELRGDDTDWASFVTETNANGGDTAQASGLLNITTSTATNGSAILSSLDTVSYRPGVGVYGAGTMIFTAGVAGSNQYFGLGTNTSFANGVQFGYKGTSFGIRYMRGGVEIAFIAQADWDDPCLGGATSNFTRAGVAEALDPTKDNLYRFEAGLFGFAGWKAEVWSPDNGWITVYVHEHINTGTTPVFESNTFYMIASNVKTSGATNISMKTQCWAAGTGTALMRVGSTITDRSLAAPVIATLQAKNPAGVHGAINRTTGGNLKISVQEISDGLDIGAGNAGTETQRVSISTDDVNLTSMIALLDDGSTFTKKTVTASTAGNNTLHTPASGKKIRLYFFGYSAGADVTGLVAALKFTTSGTVFDRQYLIAAGQPYARNIQAGKRYIDGGVDEALILNLDVSQTVYCNVELEEIT